MGKSSVGITTHVRAMRDTKERIEKVVAAMSLKNEKTTELSFTDGILRKALPKHERRLGIPTPQS